MNIAMIWYWDRASLIFPQWRDGLRAAIETLQQDHRVEWFLDKRIPEDQYDAYLIWGDSNCEAIEKISSYNGKKGLFLTTNPHNPTNLRCLDAIYCESNPVYDEVRQQGLRAIRAFGTDSEFFTPTEIKKDIEYFYPATFSPWKRQHTIAHLGKKLLCVGTVQPDGLEELQICKDKGVRVIEDYLPVEEIRRFYERTKQIIIPAIHGSERTVLEAMSMNILPTVAPENKKAHSYLNEFQSSPFNSPREFILTQYSSQSYAKAIMKGLQ